MNKMKKTLGTFLLDMIILLKYGLGLFRMEKLFLEAARKSSPIMQILSMFIPILIVLMECYMID